MIFLRSTPTPVIFGCKINASTIDLELPALISLAIEKSSNAFFDSMSLNIFSTNPTTSVAVLQ